MKMHKFVWLHCADALAALGKGPSAVEKQRLLRWKDDIGRQVVHSSPSLATLGEFVVSVICLLCCAQRVPCIYLVCLLLSEMVVCTTSEETRVAVHRCAQEFRIAATQFASGEHMFISMKLCQYLNNSVQLKHRCNAPFSTGEGEPPMWLASLHGELLVRLHDSAVELEDLGRESSGCDESEPTFHCLAKHCIF